MFDEQFLKSLADAVAARVVAQLALQSNQVRREYLTYEEVGEVIGRTKDGVRYLVRQGKIPICDDSGRVPRVHIDDVHAYMASIKRWAA